MKIGPLIYTEEIFLLAVGSEEHGASFRLIGEKISIGIKQKLAQSTLERLRASLITRNLIKSTARAYMPEHQFGRPPATYLITDEGRAALQEMQNIRNVIGGTECQTLSNQKSR